MSEDIEATPFEWVSRIKWHSPAHRSIMASVQLGKWMSAALDDPNVCDAMKADIKEWFSAGEPLQIMTAALSRFRDNRDEMKDALSDLLTRPTDPAARIRARAVINKAEGGEIAHNA